MILEFDSMILAPKMMMGWFPQMMQQPDCFGWGQPLLTNHNTFKFRQQTLMAEERF
jgi:hypothetical protein